MMQDQNSHSAAQAYRKTAIAVPPKRAVVLLYDRVLVLLEQASQAVEEHRWQPAREAVLKAAAILRGLSYIIDFKRGGALAERLYTMYAKNIRAIQLSLYKPDAPERYRKIADGLAELRDAWAEIAGLPTRAQESVARRGHAVRPVESVLAKRVAVGG